MLTNRFVCRLAHPIDRLRTKCDDFQHRMVSVDLLETTCYTLHFSCVLVDASIVLLRQSAWIARIRRRLCQMHVRSL